MHPLQQLNTISHLELLARQVVEGFIIGMHKSPFHGFSVEFAEHRLYNQGEPTKNLDWKVYARTDKMFVKRYEEETNLRCQIVIDTSSSMHLKSDAGKQQSKLYFSIIAAASLINLLFRQRDAAGISFFNEKVYVHTAARSGVQHRQLLYAHLESLLEASPTRQKTNAAACLHEIAESIHKRSMVIIFSDMFDQNSDDELFSALRHLRYNKHEVILFHVTDKKKELDFDFDNRPYKFIDLETGEQVKLQPAEVRDFYFDNISNFYRLLKLRCGQYNIDFVEADINENYNQILQTFLLKRTKMM
ncbi:MAG: DUF58 domain-containing protein [Chitinophagales bacterium]|nr:DUF58 domain-containing protein [Chitinophagales bacterium]MDW8272634.1 DUF58 domain-containing protein [Chitinophagales bacterium]